jgi:large subunit ribosomal protein L30
VLGILKIRGEMNLKPDVKKTLELLGLDRNNVLAVVEDNDSFRGMAKAVKDRVTWGELSAETLESLGKLPVKGEKVKRYRLHPPRGGFRKTIKRPLPQGELGYRGEKINELIKRMMPGGRE